MITERLQNMTVIAGDSVRFDCIATGAPRPVITWTRGEVGCRSKSVDVGLDCGL